MLDHYMKYQDAIKDPSYVEMVDLFDADNCAEDNWEGRELVDDIDDVAIQNSVENICSLYNALHRGMFLCSGPHHGPITALCIFGVCMALFDGCCGCCSCGKKNVLAWAGTSGLGAFVNFLAFVAVLDICKFTSNPWVLVICGSLLRD